MYDFEFLHSEFRLAKMLSDNVLNIFSRTKQKFFDVGTKKWGKMCRVVANSRILAQAWNLKHRETGHILIKSSKCWFRTSTQAHSEYAVFPELSWLESGQRFFFRMKSTILSEDPTKEINGGHERPSHQIQGPKATLPHEKTSWRSPLKSVDMISNCSTTSKVLSRFTRKLD